ncbi:MAG: hypothetical protein LBU65_01510 [Planctomycetaceae bacterium]|jgi:hypothetical protein|nr:hypothetical protein [Planctomycetaceae bacterium]
MRTYLFSIVYVVITVSCFAESLVFDFETGKLGTDGWRIVEGVNTKPVGSWDNECNSPQNSYDKHGTFYLTTLETDAHNKPTDDTICVIESPVFIVTGDEIRVMVGGGKRSQTYVGLFTLLENGHIGDAVYTARGEASEKLIEYGWNVSKYKGQPLVVRAVDRETGSWAHIRMDYLRADGYIDNNKTKLRDRYIAAWNTQREAEQKAREDEQHAKTELARKNPLLNEHQILYVTREQYRPDHHNTATLFQFGEINTSSFRGGSSLRVWNPKDDTVRVLLEVPQGIVRDPCLSFDAKKLLVSIRRGISGCYHIYELNLASLLDNEKPVVVLPKTNDADIETNAEIRQLTSLSDISDIDPLYLPGGEIVFSSTREPKYCMCNRHIMCNLYKMNGDGSNIRQIGKSTLFEGHASLSPDGRIIYDRWEYVDRNFGDAQGIWITSSDGFNHAIFWGNNTASPGGVIDARILPGSASQFVATFTSTHDRPWGAIALIDRQKGIDGKKSVLQTWPADAINLVEDSVPETFDEARRYDTFVRVNPKLEDPYPLSDDWFLASGMTGQGERMGIYLLGRDGTMQLVHTDNDTGCFDPQPLAATTLPPVNVQLADMSQSTGTFYVSNVYEGNGMATVKKGDAKFLRVVESPEKQTYTAKGWQNNHGEQGPGMNWYEFINKRVLGTVPIEDDGSVSFTVPADTFVYFQLLDENGRMIQTMRSGVIVRPGETNGCVGCHEDRLTTFQPLKYTPKALTQPPRQLDGWYGKPHLFSYVEDVQKPVLDKYCVQCHDKSEPKKLPRGTSETIAATMPNLAGDLNTIFNASYVDLYKNDLIKVVGAGPHTKLKPYAWGSTQSKLANVMLYGHSDKRIDSQRLEMGIFIDRKTNREAVDRVLTWIDLNAPYYPTYVSPFNNNRFGRCPLTDEQLTRLAELCGYKHRFHSGNSDGQVEMDWAISFTRPELSKCLTNLKKDSSEYKEALEIIETGKQTLTKTPRGENEKTVSATEQNQKQQTKYQNLKQHKQKMIEAIVNGKKLYDN